MLFFVSAQACDFHVMDDKTGKTDMWSLIGTWI